jgi:hypothetical protein
MIKINCLNNQLIEKCSNLQMQMQTAFKNIYDLNHRLACLQIQAPLKNVFIINQHINRHIDSFSNQLSLMLNCAEAFMNQYRYFDDTLQFQKKTFIKKNKPTKNFNCNHIETKDIISFILMLITISITIISCYGTSQEHKQNNHILSRILQEDKQNNHILSRILQVLENQSDATIKGLK